MKKHLLLIVTSWMMVISPGCSSLNTPGSQLNDEEYTTRGYQDQQWYKDQSSAFSPYIEDLDILSSHLGTLTERDNFYHYAINRAGQATEIKNYKIALENNMKVYTKAVKQGLYSFESNVRVDGSTITLSLKAYEGENLKTPIDYASVRLVDSGKGLKSSDIGAAKRKLNTFFISILEEEKKYLEKQEEKTRSLGDAIEIPLTNIGKSSLLLVSLCFVSHTANFVSKVMGGKTIVRNPVISAALFIGIVLALTSLLIDHMYSDENGKDEKSKLRRESVKFANAAYSLQQILDEKQKSLR